MKKQTMYLYHFFKKLGPLQAPNVPKPVEAEPEALVFGCLERARAGQYVKNLPENGKYFLLYGERNNFLSLAACDVTPQYEYLKQLNAMLLYNLENDKNQTELRAAVFEAVYLFGQLKELNEPALFAPYGDFAALQAVYTDYSLPDSTLPVLTDFADIPLNLQIFRAQFKYFFALYLECRCGDDALGGMMDFGEFENLVQDALSKLSDKTVCRRSKVFTDVENPEFDGFIQQIELMLPFHSELVLEALRQGSDYLNDAVVINHVEEVKIGKENKRAKEE